ncbi:BnaC04g24810D [Brassica napus]|uniref:BnaC04g24810D protein n=1 Tax=Brassica napus TaxID=3708 RepID=A0A078IB40_BRANA|nr:BnaC04g24810D [Brassica napus]
MFLGISFIFIFFWTGRSLESRRSRTRVLWDPVHSSENFETLKSPPLWFPPLLRRESSNDQTEEQIETNKQVNQANGDQVEEDPIQDLLEPFSKEQLLDLLKQAAENHPDVANRIREVADEDPSHRKIFVHGLGWDTKTETLIEAFNQYGEIEDCKASRSGARNALKQPQKKIGSRTTSCQLACKGPVFGGNAVEGLSVEHTQRKIYVSNVGVELDPEKLLAFFSRFGEEPHKTFEGHVLHCQKAIDGPKQGKQQQFNTPNHNNPRYGAPGGFMAGHQPGMGAPAQGMDPAIGQALTALLVSQGAGLGFNPALGQAFGYDSTTWSGRYSNENRLLSIYFPWNRHMNFPCLNPHGLLPVRWFGAKPLFPIQCGANFCSCIGNAQVVTERSEARSGFGVLMQAVHKRYSGAMENFGISV